MAHVVVAFLSCLLAVPGCGGARQPRAGEPEPPLGAPADASARDAAVAVAPDPGPDADDGATAGPSCTLGPVTVDPIPVPDTGPPVRGNLMAELVGDRFVMLWEWSLGGLRDGRMFDLPERRWVAVSAEGRPAFEELPQLTATRMRARVVGESVLIYRTRQTDGGWEFEGGIFDPRANTWRAIDLGGAPAEWGSGLLDVPAGREGVVVGDVVFSWRGRIGASGSTDYGDGYRFDPGANCWTRLASEGAPGVRAGAATAAVGGRVFVWGGQHVPFGRGAEPRREARRDFGDGAIYDPASDAWTPLVAEGAPDARSAAWTAVHGDRVLVLGGVRPGEHARADDGAAYDVDAGVWSPIPAPPLPGLPSRLVWTGSRVLAVFPGARGCPGAILDPETLEWTAMADPDAEFRSACGDPIPLDRDRLLFFDPPGAPSGLAPLRVLDTEANAWCFGAYPPDPFLEPSPDATSTLFRLVFAKGSRLFLVTRIDNLPPPRCPPGAPCLPGVPPRIWPGAVVLSW